MKSKGTPKNERKKYSHNKLRSQIESVVVTAKMKYNEHNKTYSSCSIQSKQIIAIKITLLIVVNVDL